MLSGGKTDNPFYFVFILLNNSEVYIGKMISPKFFRKVWFNGDNINDIDENVQYDEITDMINLIAQKTYEQKSEEKTDDKDKNNDDNSSKMIHKKLTSSYNY